MIPFVVLAATLMLIHTKEFSYLAYVLSLTDHLLQ